MKKIIITMSGSFPYGSAYALRINSFVSEIKTIGFEAIVLCDSISSEYKVGSKDGFIFYNGIKVYFLNDIFKGIKKITQLPVDYNQKLKYIIEAEKPVLIIMSSMYDRFCFVKKTANENRIPIILESCEWYDSSTFKRGKLSHHYILFSYCWKYKFPYVDGVIAISRLLEEHYKKYTVNVIRIPTVLDIDSIKPNLYLPINGKIRLLFAGSFAKTKDSIKPFFEAFNLLEDYSRFEVCVCGVVEDELKKYLGEYLYSKYKKIIVCKGKVPQLTIANEYRNSHFGIFMRPMQRSSNAGFSTKLGEGMSLGTPFIINDTSDISLYIRNNENGFIVDSHPYKIENTLKGILNMTNEDYINMRIETRRTAEEHFNCKIYRRQLEKLLYDVISRR